MAWKESQFDDNMPSYTSTIVIYSMQLSQARLVQDQHSAQRSLLQYSKWPVQRWRFATARLGCSRAQASSSLLIDIFGYAQKLRTWASADNLASRNTLGKLSKPKSPRGYCKQMFHNNLSRKWSHRGHSVDFEPSSYWICSISTPVSASVFRYVALTSFS